MKKRRSKRIKFAKRSYSKKKENETKAMLKENTAQLLRLKKKYEIPLSLPWFRKALQVELEHGTRFGAFLDITHNNLDLTTKIVKAHLMEFPDYYQRLEKMEKEADDYWKNKI